MTTTFCPLFIQWEVQFHFWAFSIQNLKIEFERLRLVSSSLQHFIANCQTHDFPDKAALDSALKVKQYIFVFVWSQYIWETFIHQVVRLRNGTGLNSGTLLVCTVCVSPVWLNQFDGVCRWQANNWKQWQPREPYQSWQKHYIYKHRKYIIQM